MPQMGVSVAEGTVVEWKKRVGDWVEADEPIVEISTDKVETEVPSPATGRVTAVLVEVGATVDVGTLLATIDTNDSPGQPHVDEEQPPPVSPVVRRIADQHHIDLSEIKGSGRRGRVTKKDVMAFIEQTPTAEPVLHMESPYREEPEPLPTAHRALPTAPGSPLSPMRQTIAKRMADLAERARNRTLTPDETKGGTFTITNPGRYGALLATPIINQPQVAILDLEAVVKRPVVVGGDSIGIRPMTYLCMSWDHRALDGVLAARFLGSVKRHIEEFDG